MSAPNRGSPAPVSAAESSNIKKLEHEMEQIKEMLRNQQLGGAPSALLEDIDTGFGDLNLNDSHEVQSFIQE